MKHIFRTVLRLTLTLIVVASTTSIAHAKATTSIDISGHVVGVGGTAVQCQIAYNANGGTGVYYGPKVNAGGTDTVCSLSQTGIIRTGYTFISWNTEKDGSGISYKVGNSIILESDITFYAQWTKTSSEKSEDKPDIPVTGDTIGTWLFVILAVISLAVAIFLLIKSRRERKNNDSGT